MITCSFSGTCVLAESNLYWRFESIIWTWILFGTSPYYDSWFALVWLFQGRKKTEKSTTELINSIRGKIIWSQMPKFPRKTEWCMIHKSVMVSRLHIFLVHLNMKPSTDFVLRDNFFPWTVVWCAREIWNMAGRRVMDGRKKSMQTNKGSCRCVLWEGNGNGSAGACWPSSYSHAWTECQVSMHEL